VAAFLGELNTKERRALVACFAGWALDSFDVASPPICFC
jgi:hypothetical protein